MGTNYYWSPPDAKCATCGHVKESLHIGKSSAGWAFSLRIHPELGINCLDDWDRRWETPGSVIEDEYGHRVTRAEMRAKTYERPSEFKPGHPMLRHVRGISNITESNPPDPSGAMVDLCNYEFS